MGTGLCAVGTLVAPGGTRLDRGDVHTGGSRGPWKLKAESRGRSPAWPGTPRLRPRGFTFWTQTGGHGSWWTRLVATGWACGVHRSGLWGIGTSPPLWGLVGRVPSGPTGGLARPGQPPCSAGGRSPSCSLCVGISQGPEEPRAELVQPPTPATCRDAHEAGPAPTRPSWLSLPRAPATSPS